MTTRHEIETASEIELLALADHYAQASAEEYRMFMPHSDLEALRAIVLESFLGGPDDRDGAPQFPEVC